MFPAAKKKKQKTQCGFKRITMLKLKNRSTFLLQGFSLLMESITSLLGYHKILQEIEKSSSTKILISREFDQQLERSQVFFWYPNTTLLLFLEGMTVISLPIQKVC